jgi:hypothetical protein
LLGNVLLGDGNKLFSGSLLFLGGADDLFLFGDNLVKGLKLLGDVSLFLRGSL